MILKVNIVQISVLWYQKSQLFCDITKLDYYKVEFAMSQNKNKYKIWVNRLCDFKKSRYALVIADTDSLLNVTDAVIYLTRLYYRKLPYCNKHFLLSISIYIALFLICRIASKLDHKAAIPLQHDWRRL